jgi:hypothetical protein
MRAAGCTEGMTDRERATANVDLGGVELRPAAKAGECLGGERLVERRAQGVRCEVVWASARQRAAVAAEGCANRVVDVDAHCRALIC